MATNRILYINATSSDSSRTNNLAQTLLSCLSGDIKEVRLRDLGLKSLSEEKIQKRMKDIAARDYTDYQEAVDFANADTIVIAAPHYDLSFPSLLKVYIENIYVLGVVTSFAPDGHVIGLCKAKKLFYVATSGGPLETRFGYEYIKALALDYFGIMDCELLAAENLDINPSLAPSILEKAKEDIRTRFKKP